MPHVYEVEKVIEKPTPSLAETELQVLGLRAGYYLCFFGMHVMTPTIFEILDEQIRDRRSGDGEILLTPAQQELARREKVLALETEGTRYDIGVRYGALRAQVALALAGVDRERVLSDLLEMVVQRQIDDAK
jgi:UTP--glucose-1-phosphate uridylyltransferase